MSSDRFFCGLMFVGIALVACLMPAQNDTWWHLRAGYDMLASHHVLLTDTYSYTVAGQPWPNNEWLSEVVFAIVHRVGGMPLLTAVCAAAIVGGLAFIYASMPADTITRVLLLGATVAGVTLTWSLRATALTTLLLGATVWLTRRERWWALPPLCLVWANLHGAVALGLVVIGGTALGHLLATRRIPRPLLVAGSLSGLATLLTPLGLSYWPGIAASIARSRVNDIAEWHMPAPPPDNLVFWTAVCAVPVFGLLRWRRLHASPRDAAAFWPAVLMLPLAIRSLRNITPFLMTAGPALAVLLSEAAPFGRDRVTNPREARINLVLLCAAGAAAAAFVAAAWRAPLARLDWRPLSRDAASAIASCPGPIYNRYIDGGPIIFFVPSQKVLLDSRQDPYPTWLVDAQFAAERTGKYRELFDRYDIRCAVVGSGTILSRALQRDGWSSLFGDERLTVLEGPRAKRSAATE